MNAEKRNYQVVVLVTGAEYAQLKGWAGEVPLSSWCRKRLLERGQELKLTGSGARFSYMPEEAEAKGKPKKNKWANKYCPEHHVLGCEVCE